MKVKILLLLPLALALSAGQNLLVNGDFEQDLSVGWDTTSEGAITHEYSRNVAYHPDPDFEAYAYVNDNPGSSKLSQTVAVGAPMLSVSFSAMFAEGGGSSSCWPAACVTVSYLSAAGTKLGETRYYYGAYVNWVSGDTLHLVRVTDSAWTEYTLDVMLELTDNLPGINPAEVAQVEVAMWAATTGG